MMVSGGQSPREFELAVPDCVTDLYALHQMVWMQVDKIHRREKGRPARTEEVKFLYRRESGRLIVRSNALRQIGHDAHLPFFDRAPRDLLICVAPFRDKFSARFHDVNDTIYRLFSNTGLSLLEHEILNQGVSTGQKMIGGLPHTIDLPFFEVKARVQPSNMPLAESFWRNGIGRGRRFGFGMPVLA